MKARTNVLAVLMLLCAAQAFAQDGVIKELSGTVELKRAGQINYIPAKPGDVVAKDTVVSTGFKSGALIGAGSAVITVRPLTRLTLAEISAAAGAETINVNLQAGRVRVDVNPPAGTRTTTTVRSPIATASVRGTVFEFDIASLAVLRGSVAFEGGRGGVKLVGAGYASEVRADGKAAAPLEIYMEELALPPLAGSVSGFRRAGVSAEPEGEFGFTYNLK
jgi:hypothetical protein